MRFVSEQKVRFYSFAEQFFSFAEYARPDEAVSTRQDVLHCSNGTAIGG